MPQSALATGMVDMTLNVAQIGTSIHDYLKNPHLQYIYQEDCVDGADLAEDFQKILEAVGHYSDIDFSAYKINTTYRRIERRIALNKFKGVGEYLDYILSSEEERKELCRDLLIGVTSFFRDKDAFLSLGERVIGPLVQAKKSIRLWSVACSTGEEAYSLAIMICEYMDALHKNTEVKIFATDVDPKAIITAQKGVYSESLLSNIEESIRDRYFDKVNHGYMICERIRKMIVFARHNIFKDAPFSKLDLIICRNMFIYVKPDMQKRVLENFYHLLNEDGFLFLGSSESVGEIDAAFSLLDKKWKIYRKNRNYAGEVLFYPMLSLAGPSKPKPKEHQNEIGKKFRTTSVLEKILFAMAGPSVLVDGCQKVVQVIKGGGPYLKMQKVEFDGSISAFFSTGLTVLLERMMTELKKSCLHELNKKATGLTDYPNEILDVQVHYFSLDEGDYFLIRVAQQKESGPIAAFSSLPLDLGELKDSRIRELEQALGESNWNLKLAVEESESRNEELQATNEELLASNEELQSTNEEMQSVNEELYTINAEYQNKILELTTANADFDNLLLNAEVGALYIDEKMCIRKITPIILQNTNLQMSDLERPIGQINFLNAYPSFTSDVEEVSLHGTIVEKEIIDSNQVIWLVRIRPYFDHAHISGGVLVTMFDITKRLEAAKFELKRLTDSVPGGVLRLVYDDRLIIQYANDSFYTIIGYSAKEVQKKLHNQFDKLLEPLDWVAFKKLIDETQESGTILKTECRVKQRIGAARWHNLQAVLFRQDGRTELQCIITDISLRKSYEEQLKKERDYYNSLYQNVVCGIVQYEAFDQELTCYSANTEAVRMLGYSSLEEFRKQSGQRLRDVCVTGEERELYEKMLSLHHEGESVNFEHRFKTTSDQIKWVSGVAKVIKAPDGKLLIQSTFMDVTEEKRALEQAKRERDQYDRLYNVLYHTAVCGIIQIRLETRDILNINCTALQILGEPDANAVKEKFFCIKPKTAKEKDMVRIGLFICLEGNYEKRDCQFHLTLEDGRIVLIGGSVSWVGETDGGKIAQFTFLDVTEQEKLKKAEMNLTIATKTSEEKSRFLSKMSHELRTPINGVAGMIDIAQLYLDDKKKLMDCFGKMRMSMQHLQLLVNDVLDMSKLECGKMQLKQVSFDLKELLGEIIQEFDYTASQNGVGLTQAGRIGHRQLISDPLNLRSILSNL